MRRYPVWLVNIWLVNRATRHNIVLRLDTCTRGANRFPKGARVLKELGEAVPNTEGRPLRFAVVGSKLQYRKRLASVHRTADPRG
jgi:hypothetical protein